MHRWDVTRPWKTRDMHGHWQVARLPQMTTLPLVSGPSIGQEAAHAGQADLRHAKSWTGSRPNLACAIIGVLARASVRACSSSSAARRSGSRGGR